MEWRTDYGAEAQVQPYGVLLCLGRRTEGVQGASGKHLFVSVYANFAGRKPTPGA